MSEFVQNWINKGRSEGITLGFNQGRSEGFSLGRTEGISIGRSAGINSMTSLMSRLYAEGRDADVKRAMTDSAYLAELLATYDSEQS